MPRFICFTRPTRAADGSLIPGGEEPSYCRRVVLPYGQLCSRRFLQLQQMNLAYQEPVTPSMLLQEGVLLFHNWVPTSFEELAAFDSAASAWTERIRCWIYDLEDPALLESADVRTILRYFRLITVPNERLQQEVRLFIRASHPMVTVLPSTIIMPNLSTTQFSPKNTWQIGLLGPHDWERFLPTFFPLIAGLQNAGECSLQFLTDQPVVLDQAQQWNLPVTWVIPTGNHYRNALYGCHIGLCPREGCDARDTILAEEYGFARAFLLAARHSSYEQTRVASATHFLPYEEPGRWVEEILSCIEEVTQDLGFTEKDSRPAGMYLATPARATTQTMIYQQILQRYLPLSFS